MTFTEGEIGSVERNSDQIARDNNRRHMRRLGVISVLLLLLTGCATTGLPTTSEVNELLSARKTLILLRVTVEVDGISSEAFGAGLADDNVGIALIAGDRVKRIEFYRSPSDETRKDGWIYLIEDPGTYYLAVQPPRDRDAFSYQFQFRYAPRWRIDALAGARIVYAGRLHIAASTEKKALFGRRVVYEPAKMIVNDERAHARELASKHFPHLGPPLPVIMEPFVALEAPQ